MSILIKMEMPKNCVECPIYDNEYLRCNITKTEPWQGHEDDDVVPIPSDCPLIEVPKHGRWELYNNTGMGFSHRCSLCGFAVRERWISLYKFCPQCGAEMEDDNAPTIIEAEGEDG